MASKYYPKQSGTTEQTFQIGAGHGKQPFTLDASGFTSPHTWVLPDSDGTSGFVLSTNGSGVLTWVPASSATSLPISSLTPAIANNTIDNTSFAQQWNFTPNSTDNYGLRLSDTSISPVGASALLWVQGNTIPGNYELLVTGDTGNPLIFTQNGQVVMTGTADSRFGYSADGSWADMTNGFYANESSVTITAQVDSTTYPNSLTIPSDQTAGGWVINGNVGTASQVIGVGSDGNTVWVDPPNSFVPITINTGETFTVPTNRQVLFAEDITVDGYLTVDGDLIEDRPFALSPSGVTPGTWGSGTFIPQITVDENGIVTYAGDVSVNAGGSNYTVQRNYSGGLGGDLSLEFNTGTYNQQWFKVGGDPYGGYNPNLKFIASFGADNITGTNYTNCLFIDNNSSPSNISIKARTMSGSVSGCGIEMEGDGVQGTTGYLGGGGFTLNAGTASTGLGGYTYETSGGGFSLVAGDADDRNSSYAYTQAVGGSFTLSGGNSQIKNNGQGGPVQISAGYVLKSGGGGGYNYGASIQMGPGISSAGTNQGGDINLVGGSASMAGSIPGNIVLQPGTGTGSGLSSYGKVLIVNTDLSITNPGTGIKIAEGTNAKQGIATLVSGTVTVNNTSVTYNSRIFLTIQNPNSTTPGYLWISGRTAGTSFTIQSSSSSDGSIVAYEIFEPY